jgi:hypothetical protein
MNTTYTIELARGVAANKPATGNPGEPYFCTDTNELLIWNGTTNTWVTISGASSGITSSVYGTYITLVSYPFTGVNADPLPAPWIADPSDGIPTLQQLNNEAVPTVVNESIGIYNGITFSQNQWAQIQLDALVGGGGPSENLGEAASVLVMRRSDSSHGFAFEVDGNSSGTLGTGVGVVIFSENGGSQTFYYGSGTSDATVSINAGDSIRMELFNGYIAAYVIHNGITTQILAPTPCDTSLTGTQIALDLFGNTLVTDAQVSNFQAGIVLSMAGVPVSSGITAAQVAAMAIALG